MREAKYYTPTGTIHLYSEYLMAVWKKYDFNNYSDEVFDNMTNEEWETSLKTLDKICKCSEEYESLYLGIK